MRGHGRLGFPWEVTPLVNIAEVVRPAAAAAEIRPTGSGATTGNAGGSIGTLEQAEARGGLSGKRICIHQFQMAHFPNEYLD